ncbi:MAG TPA: hypothetical protein VFV64_07310 [Permianibacter sp.]|nr:hypothetical protein [Permianibacter sp.]
MLQTRRLAIAVGVSAVLSGCAALQPEPPDTSPQNPTAVIVSETRMGGALLPNATGTTTTYVREDRKRTANDFKFDNWLLRNTIGRFSTGTDEVLRLDRNLQWQLNHEEKTYTECPLTGCVQPALPGGNGQVQTGERGDRGEPEPSDCKITVTKNSIKGTALNEKRQIAGANAQLFRLNWQVEMKDQFGKKASNTVTFDFWNTTPSGAVKDALDTQARFDSRYAKAMLASPQLQQLLNRDVYNAVGMLGGSMGTAGNDWAVKLGKELSKMKGYTLASTVQWNVSGETCGNAKPTPPGVSNNPVDWLTGNQVTQTAPTGPLIEFRYEVKTIGVQAERDSRFEVPRKYQRNN